MAKLIESILREEEHLSTAIDPMSDGWDAILEGFKSHAVIIPAAEAWLQKNGVSGHDVVSIAQVAMLARTDICKQILIDRVRAGDLFPQWLFKALLDLSGPDDPETREALLFYISDGERVGSVANYLPFLLTDRDSCKDRLLELLKTANGFDVGNTLNGLDKLGCLGSPDVSRILEKRLQEDDPRRFWHHAKYRLWERMPKHPLVRQGAIDELDEKFPSLSAVAEAYTADNEVRPRLEELMNPLHEDLRLILVQSLRSFALREDSYARDLLALYTRESNGEVRTIASHAYYTATKKRSSQITDCVAQLREELETQGLEYGRQQASVVGLLALKKADVLMNSVLKQDEPRIHRPTTYSGKRRNWHYIREVENSWEYLLETCGDATWRLFADWEVFTWDLAKTGRGKLLKTVPAPLLSEVRQHAHKDLDAFWALSAIEEGQVSLREFCLDLFRRMDRRRTKGSVSWGYKEEEVWIEAAHYLAKHYGEDPELGAELEDIALNSRTRIGPVIALCHGWPKAETIDRIWNNLAGRSLRSNAEMAWIVNVRASAKQFIDYIHTLPMGLQRDRSWGFPRETVRAVRHRLRSDTMAQELLMESIENTDSPDAIASLSRLLSTVVSDHDAIRDWASNRIIELRRNDSIQVMGYDMLSDQVRPIEFCLMDACGDPHAL